MKFRTLQVASLTVDKRYQRELDDRRVDQIVEDFDPRRLGTLEVSVRAKGKAAVFDGQHRLAALRRLHLADAPCIAHEGLTAHDEAELFVALQRDRRNINPVERFRARVFSGDPVAKAIKATVEKRGYSIAKNNERAGELKEIRGVTTLERIYGNGLLDETLNVASVWNGDPKSTDAMLLEGVSILLADNGDRVDSAARQRLREVSPTVILRRATGGMLAPGGGAHSARKYIAAELRKTAGVRGRPEKKKARVAA